MGVSQYHICRLTTFANSCFIWPSKIIPLMHRLHFSCKTLYVPENRAGPSSLRHQKARGDKGQHCPHRALLVLTLTKAPHFAELFGEDPIEMCWQTAEEDVVSSPNVPAPWKSQCIFHFRDHPSSPNFLPSVVPSIFTFFARQERYKFFFPSPFLLNT